MENCIFCKILKGDIPATKVYEDGNVLIINDINPIAPKHYVAIVKQHYARLADQTGNQAHVLGEVLHTISTLQQTLGLTEGYRVIMNQGKNGGQSVEHLHIHILGGKELNWEQL